MMRYLRGAVTGPARVGVKPRPRRSCRELGENAAQELDADVEAPAALAVPLDVRDAAERAQLAAIDAYDLIELQAHGRRERHAVQREVTHLALIGAACGQVTQISIARSFGTRFNMRLPSIELMALGDTTDSRTD